MANQQTYTVKQVSRILGYSTNSIYTFLREKRIKGVRVGKGRFRIPQTELDRLLGLSKNAKTVAESQIVASPVTLTHAGENTSPTGVDFLSGEMHDFDISNLFDWFVGIGSICIGLSMMLFTHAFEEFPVSESFASWSIVVRIALFSGGIGFLISDLSGKKSRLWHTVFHILVSGAFALLAYMYFGFGDKEGSIMYAIIALLLLFRLFVSSIGPGIAFPMGLLSAISIGLAVWVPNGYIITHIHEFVGSSDEIRIVVTVIAILLGFISFSVSRTHSYWLKHAATGGIALVCIGLSGIFAYEMLWGRAFLFLLGGILCFIEPSWTRLQYGHLRNKRIMTGLMGTILILIILAISVVRLVQTVTLEYARAELASKASFARFLVNSQIDAARLTIENGSDNPGLIASYVPGKKAKTEDTTSILRALYDARGSLYRIAAVYPDGKVNSVYPYASSGLVTIPIDIVAKAMATRQTVMSDFTGEEGKSYIVIASPMAISNEEIPGVLIGFVDTSIIGMRLSELVNTAHQESAGVYVKSGKLLVGGAGGSLPNMLDEIPSFRGGRNITVEDTIDDKGWTIVLSEPVSQIMGATHTYAITVFLVLAVGLIIFSIPFLMRRSGLALAEGAP